MTACLHTAGIVRMTRHVIRADGTRELCVPQDAHDLQEIHFALVGENLLKVVEASANVAHMDLVYFAPFAEVLDNGEHLSFWIL